MKKRYSVSFVVEIDDITPAKVAAEGERLLTNADLSAIDILETVWNAAAVDIDDVSRALFGETNICVDVVGLEVEACHELDMNGKPVGPTFRWDPYTGCTGSKTGEAA